MSIINSLRETLSNVLNRRTEAAQAIEQAREDVRAIRTEYVKGARPESDLSAAIARLEALERTQASLDEAESETRGKLLDVEGKASIEAICDEMATAVKLSKTGFAEYGGKYLEFDAEISRRSQDLFERRTAILAHHRRFKAARQMLPSSVDIDREMKKRGADPKFLESVGRRGFPEINSPWSWSIAAIVGRVISTFDHAERHKRATERSSSEIDRRFNSGKSARA